MDLSLSDEQQSFRELARIFLDREAVPHRTQWDRDEAIDLSIVPKMAELGFFGLTIPEEYGGLGGDYVTYALAMEELGEPLVLRHRGAEARVAPPARDGEQARLLRTHRAGHRVGRRQPDLPRRP
jgi:alkylation response protein AidB-like acyl-CoA dehydrogenase